jgi:5-methylcytosine-specific restriction protein A
MSLTRTLPFVSYEADIVEWHDKRGLASDEVARFNRHFVDHQPNEKGLHLDVNGRKAGSNLLGILRLRRITPPLAVAGFTKLSDSVPLAVRTRAGSWSYVQPPDDRERYEVVSERAWSDLTQRDILRTGRSSRTERLDRLAAADPVPAQTYVAVKMYRRNQDVIAEVLERAGGHCEDCLAAAPFLRAKDGTPFLEVHHKVRLSDHGLDTVENAIALCPNCHRKRHFGQLEEREDLEEGDD